MSCVWEWRQEAGSFTVLLLIYLNHNTGKIRLSQGVRQFEQWQPQKKLPALKTGGLYEINRGRAPVL
jgi:hypothetical protein